MIVYWAFESITRILDQDASVDLSLQLGKEEQAFLELLRFKKRREEWLAGRLAMKKLLTTVIPEFADLQSRQIQILKLESGAPTLRVDTSMHVQLAISLSHSNGYLLCAVSPRQQCLGADLELIENRSEAFINDYFTPKEIELIGQQLLLDRDFLSTLIWSEKEAVLKALSLGLKMDTRQIEIELGNCQQSEEWQTNFAIIAKEKSLHLLWRRQDKFVFSLCGENISSSDLVQVSL